MTERAPMPVADRPTVRLKASSYQPSPELEADVGIDMTPEQLAEAALGVVTIQADTTRTHDSALPWDSLRRLFVGLGVCGGHGSCG